MHKVILTNLTTALVRTKHTQRSNLILGLPSKAHKVPNPVPLKLPNLSEYYILKEFLPLASDCLIRCELIVTASGPSLASHKDSGDYMGCSS